MFGQTQHSSVKTSSLPDKFSMIGASLQAFESDVVDHGSAVREYSSIDSSHYRGYMII